MPTNPFRAGATAALILSLITPIATPVFAQNAQAEEAKHRVNLAGRQRMLSQRMSMAACFIYIGVERDKHADILFKTHALFDSTHTALRDGDEELGLSEEVTPEVINALVTVDTKWSAYSPMASQVVSEGKTTRDALQSLNVVGLEVLDTMNSAVGETARAYGGELDELPMLLSLTIDFAGRQRMLTQKMTKEFCLIDAGIDAEENRVNLAETLSDFNATHEALVNGYPGMIMAAPNYDIRSKLTEVSTLWESGNAAFTRIADGEEITDLDRGIAAKEIEAVLDSMNEAVEMYEYIIVEDLQ